MYLEALHLCITRKSSYLNPRLCIFFHQVSYAIGVAEPLSITVMDYGTSEKTCAELTEIVKKNFDLRPGRIVKYEDWSFTIFTSEKLTDFVPGSLS